MKRILILFAWLVAFGASGQTAMKEIILTGPVQDTATTYTRLINKGGIRYDTINDEYAFWDDQLNTWFKYQRVGATSGVPTSRQLTIAGTAGRITSSAGAQDLSADRTWTLDLASGIATPGTYKSVTVDTYGRVTAGTNPTTLSGFGVTDAWFNGATTTLSALTTVTSNAANQLLYDGSWTAGADNDFHENRTGALTSNGTTSASIIGSKYTYAFTSGGTTQRAIAVDILPTFGGSYAHTVALRVGGGKTVISNTSGALPSTNAQLSIYGASTGTNPIMLLMNSAGTSRHEIRENGQAFWTTSNGNSFNFSSTQTATSSGLYHISVAGTQTGRGTSADEYMSLSNTHNFTSGATNQIFSASRNTATYTYNHTGGFLRGYDWNPTIAGTQTASLTHLSYRAVTGQFLQGGSTITAGSVLADFQSANSLLLLPRVTNRAAVTTPVSSGIGYSAATGTFDGYEAGNWKTFLMNYGTYPLEGNLTLTGGSNTFNINKTAVNAEFGSLGLTLTQAGAGTSVLTSVNATTSQYLLANGGGTPIGRVINNGGSYFAVESLVDSQPVRIHIPGVTATSGTYSVLNIKDAGSGFAPTSGTATYIPVKIDPAYNATGGTTTVVGVDYDPNVTSLTGATHYAWRHDQGFIAWQSKLSPSQITSDQTDYNPTGWSNGGTPNGASVLRLDTDASRNLNSLAGGVDGRIVVILNVGGFDLVVQDDDGSTGTASMRFALPTDITIVPDDSRTFIYDGTSSRWRIF